MRFDSLAFRLFATFAVWTLLILPLAGYLIYSLYRDDGQANFDAQLRKLLTAITVDSMNTIGNEPIVPQNLYEPLFEVTHSGWYWQIQPFKEEHEARGKRLVSPSLATGKLTLPSRQGVQPDNSGTRWINARGLAGEPVRIFETRDWPGHDSDKLAYSVAVAGPLDWLEEANAKFRNRLTTALALAGLALVAVMFFQVRFGLAPLRRIEKGLASIRSGDAEKLEGRLPAEIEPLQTELNALIESNQQVIERARTQVGNLAHALKTPLAVITNEARGDRSQLGEKVAAQAQLMRDQVTHYLDRARIAARAGTIGRVTVVSEVVSPLVRTLERIYQDKHISIEIDVDPKARFQGERQDLEEMLGNILDNACKWADQTAYLTVSTEGGGKHAKKLVLLVEDDGGGVPKEKLAQISKRGMCLDETKPGSGLGLSIVRDLAESYRGQMALADSERGGLKVRLELPAA